MKKKAVHQTPDLDPSVVEKILARHEGELSDPVVYRDDRPLESKGSATRPPHMGGSETHICGVCGACGPIDDASETSERFEQLTFEAAGIGGEGNG
ncbi:MAG: hypothetical protein QF558_03070 [Acidimicrobiales bacterium]|nr:hypothetical protein [Acidimicrobiales bacterium]